MTEPERKLAIAVLSLAEDAGMPDSFWDTDSRIGLALETLWHGCTDWNKGEGPSRAWVLENTGLS